MQRSHETSLDSVPKVNSIFRGEVASLQPYGIFVKIPGCEKNGLVHISQISNSRIERPEEVVEMKEKIYCKVISVEPDGQKISLSMKVVNQTTGQDLDPNQIQTSRDEQKRKKDFKKEFPKIELGAVFNTVCKKCGGKGHLAQDCFHVPGGKTYQLLEEVFEWPAKNADDGTTGCRKHKKKEKKEVTKDKKHKRKHKKDKSSSRTEGKKQKKKHKTQSDSDSDHTRVKQKRREHHSSSSNSDDDSSSPDVRCETVQKTSSESKQQSRRGKETADISSDIYRKGSELVPQRSKQASRESPPQRKRSRSRLSEEEEDNHSPRRKQSKSDQQYKQRERRKRSQTSSPE